MKFAKLCCLLMVVNTTGFAAKKAPLKIGIHDWIGYYPIYLGIEKGYFGKKDEVIKLSNSEIGQNGIASMVSGKR